MGPFINRRTATVFLCLLPFLVTTASAGPAPDEKLAALDAQLDRILAGQRQPGLVLSAHVIDLTDNRTLYDYQSDQPLAPASVMKLVVCAAALDTLGPDFKFVTRVGLMNNDLVVIGGGDPTLGDPKLTAAAPNARPAFFDACADQLLAKNIRRVSGKLVIDDSLFDARYTNPNWPADQFQDWYEAPIGALNYADNCVELEILPAKPGSPPAVTINPASAFIDLAIRAQSVAKGARNTVAARRKLGANQIAVTGNCAAPVVLGPMSVSDPGLFFAGCLRAALAQRGIVIDGPTERHRIMDTFNNVPAGFQSIVIAESPITAATRRACTDSLGMMAEGVIKSLGAARARPGSWQSGAAAVAAFLNKLGVSDTAFVIDDGSGLSRRNRVSARAVTTILAHMNRSRARDALLNSLAQPGKPGTLQKRLRELTGRVHAKTGYINGVRTLAGYIDAADNHKLAFAFLYNGARSTAALTKAQDDACRLLARWPELNPQVTRKDPAQKLPAPTPRKITRK